MKRARVALAGLWITGLVLGSLSERDIPSSPLMYDGFQVLSADLHVHSFPGDGALPPWALAPEARRRGLDAIALTNHNQMLSWNLEAWFRSPSSRVLMLPGEEVTTPSFHMAAVGVRHRIKWDRSAGVVVGRVHAAGGVAIAAHPNDRAVEALDSAFEDLDGIEAAHPVRHQSDEADVELNTSTARALAKHPSIAQIGSSDFHYLAPVGLCRTYIFARAAMVKDVLDAIREGRTVACDARGLTYGDPRLSLVVAGACRRAASADSDLDRRLNRIAVLCAWLGAAGLTLFGPRRG